MERFYIEEARRLLSRGNVYNISTGGDGQGSGIDHPFFGKFGAEHPSYGMHHSEEAKEKMRQKKLGGRQTKEHIRKRIEAQNSEEARMKMKKAWMMRRRKEYGYSSQICSEGVKRIGL